MARALLALSVLLTPGIGLSLSRFASECNVKSEEMDREGYKIHILAFIPCSRPKGNVTEGNVSSSVCPDQTASVREEDFDLCDWVDDIPILAMTLDQINSDPTLLPGYRLVLDNVKSGCSDPIVSTVTLHNSISKTLQGDGPVHHMILGPACTVATEPVAELSGKYLNINQVSYTASGTQFENRERFPRLYTLQPLVLSYNDAYVHLIRSFGWKRVAVINEVDPLFSKAAANLRDKLDKANIAVEYFGSFDSDGNPSQQLRVIKEKDLRIIIALVTPNTCLARALWCEAARLNITGDLHVWFTPVWSELDSQETYSCNNDDIKTARAHSFGVLGSDLVEDRSSKTMLVSRQSAKDFYDQLDCYKRAFKREYPDVDPNKTVDVTLKEGYVYDSIWAIALALNRTIQRGIALENFTYDNDTMADIMQEELRNSNFTGISGQVFFTANGSNETGFRRDPFLEIRQYNESGYLQLRAIYNTSGMDIISNHSNYSWPPEGRPLDGPTPQIVPYPLWSVCTVAIVTGIGMVCAITCLVVTLAYRKHRAFKRSTFRLNAIICIAIFLGFLGGFVSAISVSVNSFLMDFMVMEAIANVANCLYHISFVLAFSSLLIKTWRIYRIFCNSKLRKRKFLDDKYLVLAVWAVVALDVVVLIVWTSLDEPRLKWMMKEFPNMDNPAEKLVVYYAVFRGYFWAFLCLLVIPYVMMLLFGMFMAYQIKQNTRSFYNKYNDSPIVNLSSLLALTVSFGSLALILAFTLTTSNADKDSVFLLQTENNLGILLLLVVLRDGSWMFPMLGFMYLPMIFELVREKYTGKSISRRGSTFSTCQPSIDPSSILPQRYRSLSISSYPEDIHRRISLEASPSPSRKPSASSVGESSVRVIPQLLTPLTEEATESIPGESTHRKTSYDVAQASPKLDNEVFRSPRHQSDVRRPSILKLPLSSDSPPEERRGSHHRVQFTESQLMT